LQRKARFLARERQKGADIFLNLLTVDSFPYPGGISPCGPPQALHDVFGQGCLRPGRDGGVSRLLRDFPRNGFPGQCLFREASGKEPRFCEKNVKKKLDRFQKTGI
jgi:hypothetical protein